MVRRKQGAVVRRAALFAVLGATAAWATVTPIVFGTRTDYLAGRAIRGVGFADLNEDGSPDMIAVNGADDSLTRFLGAGDGTFGAGSTISTGRYPISVATADFDGDGHADAAAACFQHSTSTGTVEVHFGDGTGAFPRRVSLSADVNPLHVFANDVDGDGDADLVVVNYYPGGYTVFLGDGAGGFTRVTTSQVRTGNNVHWAAMGDIDGDGRADLVMANSFSGNVTAHLTQGTGTFTSSVWTQSCPTAPYGVALGDADGDGNLDLAVAMIGRVDEFLGAGTGTFHSRTTRTDPAYFAVVGYADLNRDGLDDLMIAGPSGPSSFVDVVAGDASRLGPVTRVQVGHTPYLMLGIDLDGDTMPEMAVANSGVYGTSGTSSVSILSNGTTPPNGPPVADAGDDITVECVAGGTNVTLDGSRSSDPDGDALSWVWTGGFTGGTAFGATPTVTFPAGTGTYDVALSVSDGASAPASDVVRVVVRDTTAPVIAAPADVTVECTSPAGQAVSIGSATASDNSGSVVVTNDAPATFVCGTTVVTWTATDPSGHTATALQTIRVLDRTAPTITVTGLPSELWPPNHQLVRIQPTIVVSDAADAAPTVTLTISSSEPDNGQGDGDTAGDSVIRGPADFDLRAERSGTGNGRTYTLTWVVTDASGNATSVSATVVVPKSKGRSR